MPDPDVTPRERKNPSLDSFESEDTGRRIHRIAEEEIHRLAVPRSEVNGFFDTGRKMLDRAKLLVTVIVAIGGAGAAFGIWKSSLVTRVDLGEMDARMGVLELQGLKQNLMLESIIKRMDRREERDRKWHPPEREDQ
jgi:hypothetical protein